MNITLNHIKHAVKYNNHLLVKGSAVYRQDNIIHHEIQIDHNDVIRVDASIRENENVFVSNIRIAEGEIISMGCDCYEFGHGECACRHIVGLLYLYMYELYEDEVVRYLENTSDPLALSLIQDYLTTSIQSVAREDSVNGVELIPRLVMDEDGDVSVSFQIGTTKRYILRDIDQFLMNLQEENVVSYGKALTFRHTLSSFDAKARKLIAFMERRKQEIDQIVSTVRSGVSSYYMYQSYGYNMKKTMPLTPSMLDELIEMYIDSQIALTIRESNEEMYYVMMDNPDLCLSIQQRNANQYVLRMMYPYDVIRGAKSLYIAQGKILHIPQREYQKDMNSFLKTMKLSGGSLILHQEHMNAFYNTVYGVIQKHLRLEEQADLTQFEPTPLTTKLYFDAYEQGVSLVIKFVYDTIEYWYGVDAPCAHRNIAEEAKILHVIEKYFYDKSLNEFGEFTGYYIITEENQLFFLVSEGFDELSNYAELYYSVDFKNIRVKQPPSVSAGVRLVEGLLHVDFDIEDFDMKELRQLLGAYRQNKKYYRTKDGSFMQLDKGSLSSLTDLMDSFHLTDKDILKKSITIPKYRAMQMDSFIKSNEQMKFDRDRSFKQLIRDFSSVSDSDFEIDAELKPILRNYQKSGYRWLKTMATYQFGGILADDMGLGKTLQVIALLKNLKKEHEATTSPVSIVICPASLVLNWENEIVKFAPMLSTTVVIGSIKQRQDLIAQCQNYDVVITSYDLLKRDVELYQNITFHYQIIDEAQYIKNHNTQAAKSVKDINSKQRFALSGTPVENSLAELWSIFDYLMPNYLYPYHYFKERYEMPIVKDEDRTVVEKLRKMVQPFILRRLKKDVLKELPDKVESTMFCQLEGEQEKLYVANAIEMSKELSMKLSSEGLEKNKLIVLALLTKLRQICCHPKLCYGNYTGTSSKLDMCMELVRNAIDGNHRVLIFSSFTSMLDLIKEELNREMIAYFELTGSTPKFKRMELVNAFQDGEVPVFLISLKAGGTGLNLTAADTVIHFDPWWNISAQNQATDRTHRIGQTANVNVYNLIAKNTIEEKILKLQEKKRSLADAIVEEGGNLISTMSKDDILSLFEVNE